MKNIKQLLDKLYKTNNLTKEEIIYILENLNETNKQYLFYLSQKTLLKTYGNKVFVRALLEFSNYCKNTCKYCGLRKYNQKVDRYRLKEQEIFNCLEEAHRLGYRTFVLQSGEDMYYTDNILENLTKEIKFKYPDTALTFSIGEKNYDLYKKLYNAGADRYLLRHETISEKLYNELHPDMNFENRKNCLYNLKKIGYQTGAGLIVGLPKQNNEILASDLLFLQELNCEMVGIGPLIPHPDTPLKNQKTGSIEKTLILLAFTRLLLPETLLPSTTALNSLCENGLEKAIKAGANVVMLNVSPVNVRKKYEIYKNKETTDIYQLKYIENKINSVQFCLDMSRGDNLNFIYT